MARKEKKYHYIYKITCTVTNRFYIGMHSTDNLDDGYFGSGKRLWFSINYHGKDNHIKEILEFLDSREALKKREAEIVNEQLIKEDLCMNLQTGGQGGFCSEEHQKKCSKAGIKKLNEVMWQVNGDKNRKRLSKESKDRWKNKNFRDKIYKNLELGRKNHSEESKKKISESMKGKGVSKNNSQFGTCWITKDGENKKIKKEDLGQYIKDGWVKGRKL